MRFILLLLSFLFFKLNLTQTIQIKANIGNNEQKCDTDLKQYTLYKKLANGDSLVFTFQDSSCVFLQDLELTEGQYILRIKSVLLNTAEVNVNILRQMNALLDLGEIKIGNKVSQVEEVTITGVPKRFIQTDPEKTIVTVENNAVLESGSLYDAILKIPGIIPAPSGGFTYSGQPAGVFFEGIPSSLQAMDLDNLLRGLPATSVKKIELVTNPGASYDANFSGAIIDIISHDKSFKWLSGSINMNIGINQNRKMMPGFVLNGKVRKFSWNIQSNYSYQERNLKASSDRVYTFSDSLGALFSERKEAYTDQYYSLRGNLTARVTKKSTLQLSAGWGKGVNEMGGYSQSSPEASPIPSFTSDYLSESSSNFWDGGFKYRIILDSLNRKLEIAHNYSHYASDNLRRISQEETQTRYSGIQSISSSDRNISRLDLELPFKNRTTQLNFGLKSSFFTVENEGSYRFNDTIEPDWNTLTFNYTLPFIYREQNLAFYSEFKKRFGKKFAFTLGVRGEDFRVKGETAGVNTLNRVFTNFFPSLHLLYRPFPDMKVMVNYSRKINMPGYNMFDPNLTGYYDSYTQNSGNKALDPNFLHRSQLKFAIFDYLQLSMVHTFSNSVNLTEVFVDSNSLNVNYSYRTYQNVQGLSGFFSLPVPFGVFTQGLDFFRQPIEIDAISFMYLYTNWEKTFIPDYDYVNGNRGQWRFGVYSQFILPLKIRMNVEYNISGTGMSQITQLTKNIHELEIVFSREFFDKKFRVSAAFQDLLNTDRYVGSTVYRPLSVSSYSKWDTRVVWFKLAYSFGRYERPSLKENAIPEGKGE